MKSSIWILLMIGIISCTSDSTRKVAKELVEVQSVEELEKSGFQAFQEAPQKAIPIFKQVATKYEEQKNLKKAGQTNLNIANIYDEYSNEIDSALLYSHKSLKNWETRNDTLQIANLHKYIGLLKGKVGNFEEGKLSILEAIELYKAQGFKQGIAVSEFNLADLYFRQNKFEESELLLTKSIEFWKEQGQFSRVFTNNLLGIKLYDKIGKKEEVQKLIEENMEIKNKNKLNDFIENQFEKLIEEIKKEVKS